MTNTFSTGLLPLYLLIVYNSMIFVLSILIVVRSSVLTVGPISRRRLVKNDYRDCFRVTPLQLLFGSDTNRYDCETLNDF